VYVNKSCNSCKISVSEIGVEDSNLQEATSQKTLSKVRIKDGKSHNTHSFVNVSESVGDQRFRIPDQF
jgi:hypothetical protein